MKTLITVEVERAEDLAVIIPVLNKLKVAYSSRLTSESDYEEVTAFEYDTFMEQLNALGGKEGTVSSFGDAAEYQKEIRKDRKMPFRDE